MPLEDKDTIIKIFESLGEIKGQLANLDVVREKADAAHEKATSSMAQSAENKEDISELKLKQTNTSKVAHEARDTANYNTKKITELQTNFKWSVSIAVPTLVAIVGWIVNHYWN